MLSLCRLAWKFRTLCATTALLAFGAACASITAPPPPPTSTAAVTISPTLLPASVNDPLGLRGRYMINPQVTFSAAGTTAENVKEVRFAFVVDVDRVIREGAFLVHNGDLRGGPITQQYPLTFDVPVHFPNLRVRMTATFIDASSSQVTTALAEASIQLPGAQR
jgi:hypothetical protein